MKNKLTFQCLKLEEIKNKIQNEEFGEKVIFNFLNSNDIYNFKKEKRFKESLINRNTKQVNFIDGYLNSLILSFKNFRRIFRTRGPRFTKFFLNDSELNKNKKHFFIGLDREKKELLVKNTVLNNNQVEGYNPPYIKSIEFPEEEVQKITEKIGKTNPDYIWVCVGSPKQNILAEEICKKIEKKLDKFYIFNVGAALDFITGTKKEAPRFVQEIGVEWLYRLVTDFKYSKKKVWRSLIGSWYGLVTIELNKNKEF